MSGCSGFVSTCENDGGGVVRPVAELFLVFRSVTILVWWREMVYDANLSDTKSRAPSSGGV